MMNFQLSIFNGVYSKNNSKFKIKHLKLNCFAFSKLNVDINSFELLGKIK